MTDKVLEKANKLTDKINNLENFMFWCSGKREGLRKYPVSVIKIKRKWFGGVEKREYEVSMRLQEKISNCMQEELDLLKSEFEGL